MEVGEGGRRGQAAQGIVPVPLDLFLWAADSVTGASNLLSTFHKQ